MILATTILAVLRGGTVTLAGDGQVTIGDMVMKHSARKIRKLYKERVLAGFAGAVADALTLFEKFESQLDRNKGNLRKAQLIVADPGQLLVLSGDGEVIEPDDGVVAIGSGGSYALAAARALVRHTDYSSTEIARLAMEIAGEMDIYTNNNIAFFTLTADSEEQKTSDEAPAAEPAPAV
jgi:ATP-dependent HslUV protease subunit HslV